MNIADILDEIMKAVYGRDVRQSMHDGIEACAEECTNMELKFQQLKKEISIATTGLFKEISSEELNLTNESRWMVNPRSGTYGKVPVGLSYGNYQTGILAVQPKELYRVTVYVKDTTQEIRNVLAFADGTVQDENFSDPVPADILLEEGKTDYYVEVPDGCNLMLMTTEDCVSCGIEVAKARLA